jgi:ABC-2 type transport system permease protein
LPPRANLIRKILQLGEAKLKNLSNQVIAYLSVGALMQLLARDLVIGLSFTSATVSPAFGYLGVGFPILGMNAFAHAWSAILPLRWYMAVLFGQAARGLPVQDSAGPFAVLAALAALYALLAFLRLRAVGGSLARSRPSPEPAPTPRMARGIGATFLAEWRRVLTTRSAFTLLVLGPVLYGIYYPQPYLTQILRKVPIAIVDTDQSELSRRIVETIDASGAVQVAFRARTLADARIALDRGEAFAPWWVSHPVPNAMSSRA